MVDINTSFGGNTIQQYLIAIGIFFGTLVIVHIIKSIVISRIAELTKKTKHHWDDFLIDLLQSLGWLFYGAIALTTASTYIAVDDRIQQAIYAITLITLSYYTVMILQQVIERIVDIVLKKQHSAEKAVDKTITGFFHTIIRAVLWITATIIVLQNLGYNVTALLGGLGIAGIAIAFALQNILTDIFAFFTIYFDKPFQKGDFINLGTDSGTVEHVGIKSTRIKTLQGQELIVSNQDMLSSRINNFKKMEKRRISFAFGVTYETPNTKLRKIPTYVREIMKKEKLAEIDRVHFTDFGDFSLNYEVIFYMLDKDYTKYRNTQQSINLALKKKFEEEEIDFAYPTQLIYTQQS